MQTNNLLRGTQGDSVLEASFLADARACLKARGYATLKTKGGSAIAANKKKTI